MTRAHIAIVTAGAMLILGTASAWAAPVRFAAPPTAERDGTTVRIGFAVSGPTDVEVAVLGSDGQVVRHLAAGVLGGPSAPPSPLRPGLSQTLVWDGKDNAGADRLGDQAAGGPFSVRVRIGMDVTFGRFLGGSPYTGHVTTGAPSDSIAVDADGTLYVKMGSFVPQLHAFMPWQVRQFDRTGAYQRTVLPYPASTPPASTPGFSLIDTGDGRLTPASMTPLDPVLFHLGDNIHHRVVGGRLVFVDSSTARLHSYKLDGSNELKSIPMRSAPDKLKWAKWLAPQLAFSPDGRTAYYSNVANTPYDGKKPSDIDPDWPQGRIYRQDLTQAGADPRPFYDLELPDWETAKYWMPSAWDKKTAAAGIDTDAKGNVLVCDLVNMAVVEIDPQGRKVSSTPVDWPDKIVVSRKTGDLYVVSRKVSRGHPAPATLLKISGRGEQARTVARLELKGQVGTTIALDDSGERAVLLLGGGGELFRVEDRGGELAVLGDSIINRDADAIGFVCYMAADPHADLVYVTQGMGPVWRYDGKSGAGGLAPIRASDLAIGPDGMIYAWGNTGSYQGPITRYSRDFKPAPLEATGSHTYGHLYCRYGRGNSVAGLSVDPRGWVFATNGGNSCHVEVYDHTGRQVAFDRTAPAVGGREGSVPALITGMTDMSGSIRVDPAGNVYVLQIGRPNDHVAPRGFEKDPAYQRCTGTIYKFGPAGGEFAEDRDGRTPVGALAAYSTACGPISGAWASTGSVCHCTKPRFDVDGYGRLYIPNAFTFQVTVCDNADNRIVGFGRYGNFDDAATEATGANAAIPLGWPIAAAAGEDHIYVGDCLNHRVVRVDKVFAAEHTCPVN